MDDTAWNLLMDKIDTISINVKDMKKQLNGTVVLVHKHDYQLTHLTCAAHTAELKELADSIKYKLSWRSFMAQLIPAILVVGSLVVALVRFGLVR